MIFKVIIKMLHLPPKLLEEEGKTRLDGLLEELSAVLLSSDTCRFVCRYLGFERRGDKLMVAARREEGETLSAHIRRHQQHQQNQMQLLHPEDNVSFRGLPLSQALGILKGLAQGLQELHHRGICDIGLNPESVFILGSRDGFGSGGDSSGIGSGSVLISDLGLSRIVAQRGSATASGASLSSVGIGPLENYQPPEKLGTIKPGVSRFSGPMYDMWALAGLAVYMLTGNEPMPAPQIMYKVRRGWGSQVWWGM